jgi:hypothetical protein
MDPTKEQHPILCISRKKFDKNPGNDYTSVQGRNHELYKENSNSSRQKRARRVKSKVKSMLIIFFETKWIVLKKLVMASQTVNTTYHCDILH